MSRAKSISIKEKAKDIGSWLPLFRDFISNLSIDSKELGITPLDQVLYTAQITFLEDVCKGLDKDVHHFVVLKARQLGISTISLAMDLFWLAVHPGIQGALVVDTDGNRDKFRIILERYIASLPKDYKIKVDKHNKNNLVLSNGSVLDYLVAGKRKSGNLGRGRALNFLHATECSSWGDPEGVASLMSSLAESHPDRLYIFESTARGFNLFWDMWKNAEEDKDTQKTIFLGWWSKDQYRVKKDSQVYKSYWNGELTEVEKELVAKVRSDFGFDVKPEQIAWYRWKETTQVTGENMMAQEFPWTPEQAFIATGTGFFNRKSVARDITQIYNDQIPFFGYRYHMGDDFLATEIEEAPKLSDIELRIWEMPVKDAIYVMGVDPAYGRSDHKDKHCIEVYRCYADKLVQVAEYATHMNDTKNVAWVMCHLAGLYKQVWINLEIVGPGWVVKNELDHLKQLLTNGYLNKRAEEAGMKDIFQAVSWYLWHRPDSMGSGYVYGFQTTTDAKLMIMNQYRDSYSSNYLMIKSVPLMEEMQTIVQDGSEIAASGSNKDDRVFASALAIEAWIKWVRGALIAQNMTYENVTLQESKKPDMMMNMVNGIITDTFRKAEERRSYDTINAGWDDE